MDRLMALNLFTQELGIIIQVSFLSLRRSFCFSSCKFYMFLMKFISRHFVLLFSSSRYGQGLLFYLLGSHFVNRNAISFCILFCYWPFYQILFLLSVFRKLSWVFQINNHLICKLELFSLLFQYVSFLFLI